MTNFNQILEDCYQETIKKYPDAKLYEIQAELDENNEVINSSVLVVSGLPDGGHVQTKFNKKGAIYMRKLNSPWLEDRPITPYISMRLDDAIELASIEKARKVTLRHQLHPAHIEPEYIIDAESRYFIGVWSNKVTVENDSNEPKTFSKLTKERFDTYIKRVINFVGKKYPDAELYEASACLPAVEKEGLFYFTTFNSIWKTKDNKILLVGYSDEKKDYEIKQIDKDYIVTSKPIKVNDVPDLTSFEGGYVSLRFSENSDKPEYCRE